MALTRMNDQIGRVLAGRYRLLAPIGAGASAQVFLAEDTRLRRRVAIKLLHESFADDEAFIRRFHSEAQAAAGLNHPNLLSVYDWGDEEVPFLVTEFIGGGSLRAMLDRGHRLSLSQATLVGLQSAQGLDHAHRQGLVHRDLKPANLLFGEDGRLRIADFGLARALADAAVTEQSGSVLGTARYASPEQAQGRALSGRSDVYSMALVLIEAVTGEVPFAVDTTIGTLMARTTEPIPVPVRLEGLRPLLRAAGSVDPEERPDAAQLATLLVLASEELDPPDDLPLAGAIVLPDAELEIDRDPTMLPTRVDGEDDELEGDLPEPLIVASGPGFFARRRLRRIAKRTGVAERRPRRRLLVTALVLVGLLLLAGGGYGGYQFLRPEHAVPALEGIPVGEVGALVDDLGFDVELVGVRQNGVPPGSVIGQDPAEGAKLREGDQLTLQVARGPELVEVPDNLLELTVPQAAQRLQEAGLTRGFVSGKYNELVVADIVQAVPLAFDEVPRRTAINLVVSLGPRPRVIPADAVGRQFDDLAAELESLSLVVDRRDVPTLDVPPGTVTAVEPDKGTSVARDSTVTVFVAVAQVEVPDVTGLDVFSATDELEARGFIVSDVRGSPRQDVTRTDPEAGQLVAPGTQVTLYTNGGD